MHSGEREAYMPIQSQHTSNVSLSDLDDISPRYAEYRNHERTNMLYFPVSPIDNTEYGPTTPRTPPDSVTATPAVNDVRAAATAIQTSSSPPSDMTEGHMPEAPNAAELPSKTRRRPFLATWWWWWEIGATIISVVCFSLVVVLLQEIDGQCIDLWPYSIRPNSLLSVLTTIGRAAMMVPVASCLGQAKWSHFQRRSHALDHVQLYDDASRGPWGSFLLLLSGRLKAAAACGLAVVTILGLGIDPSVQQILELRIRQAPLANTTALIGRADNYTSRSIWSRAFQGWGGPQDPTPHNLELQTAIANGVLGTAQSVGFHCPEPATSCIWDQFQTLAVCASFRNVTNDVRERHSNSTMFIYDFPEGNPVIMDVSTLFHSVGFLREVYNGMVLNGIGMENATDYANLQRLYFSIELNWCLRTYHHVVASPAGIKEATYTTEPLRYHNNSANTGRIGGGNFAYQSYEADSSQVLFNISTPLRQGLWIFINELFSREIHAPIHYDEQFDDNAKFGEFLYYANMPNFTKNLEETLTNQIRSSSTGDNQEAVMFAGQAFYQETYWYVEWPWITLPIVEVFLTALLLLISIVFTWRHPLLKSSALALLFHGLQDNNEHEQLPYLEADAEKLEDLAKTMRVGFMENENGVMRFICEDKEDTA
ncbi:hypothetical protein GGR54DRAFT_581111 [Hypoxylon sp. NC1633]|nr:hypothetical protein GGR54DRAFT_581111 [Hypoxylon sp. NC1633]